ncbi:MAG: amidophosphoribosyltransferase [Clostridia bacterium]|nr:amidophosphoribosyltransferase [Clostridia bacterium]
MGGMFGVVSDNNCVLDLFFGIDYHSHLGTKRAGMAVFTDEGDYDRSIHNIENSPFRTKFENDLSELKGKSGIGCISDNDPQPLLVQSHLGSYAITTLGKINNMDELVDDCFKYGHTHFLERSGGRVNATELVAALINQKGSLEEGLLFAQDKINGSISILILSGDKIYASRDKYGRTPLIVGTKDGAKCISFEDFAYFNLGFTTEHELGPNEVALITKDKVEVLSAPKKKKKVCAFLWVYYGYPPATYEGVNVEAMRYICGKMLAKRDNEDSIKPDLVAGIPDSGIAHAVGYANESGIPFARPFIKYTPTWPRSFMPQNQAERERIAKMKLIPVHQLIKDKSLLLIDDSIVRGTQLGETTEFLYQNGAKEVHIRPACPPLLFGCKYLDFSRSKSELDLITRRIIKEREGDNVTEEVLKDYANPDSQNYKDMIEEIRKRLGFTSLRFHRLDDLIESIGMDPDCLCTYCWNGEE